MNTPKTQFQQNNDLRNWLTGITHDPRFDLCLTFATAELANRKISQAQMDGAILFIRCLTDLPENSPDMGDFPTPGLRHDIDVPADRKPPTPNTEEH